MKLTTNTLLPLACLAITTTSATAATVLAEIDYLSDNESDGTFVFDSIPSNSSTDFANGITFGILDGSLNASSAPISSLTDGQAQLNADQPSRSVFSADGSPLRVQLDLGATISISQINTFSWHPNSRSAQRYNVYGASAPTNNTPTFTDAGYMNDAALSALGYTLIASVESLEIGGQRGVSISDITGSHQYLLFDIESIDAGPGSRSTFFGEIDVTSVPEPHSALLSLLGLSTLIFRRTRS